MPTGLLPLCQDCKHFTGVEPGIGFACRAFGDGIPVEILSSSVDHREPFKGDGGVRYEPRVMDETELANAIANGELDSPQWFLNSWYFKLRVSGTGASYRAALDEYVWRDPAIYLSEEFLKRCYVPVIIEHPDKMMLDTEEYRSRNIGMSVLPYIADREGRMNPDGPDVWTVARIIDRPAADFMRKHQVSTSPSVVFPPDGGDNTTVDLTDGKHLLIEGKPALIDHIAIASAGVWDKGEEPSGVDIGGHTAGNGAERDAGGRGEEEVAKDDDMRDDDKMSMRDDDKMSMRDDNKMPMRDDDDKMRMRDDAEQGEKLDKLLEGIKVMGDAMKHLSSRMDAMEDDSRKRDDAAKKKDDEDPDHEHRQAAELERLAAEEREEGEEAEDDKRGDAGMRMRGMMKRDDETHAEHSARIDARARMRGMKDMCRDDGESAKAHSMRMDRMMRKHMRMDAENEETEPEKSEFTQDKRKDRGKRDAAEEEMGEWEEPAADKRDDAELGEEAEKQAAKGDMRRGSRMRDDDDDDMMRDDAMMRMRKADARADAARTQRIEAELAALKRRFADSERSDEDADKFADERARADSVYAMFNQRAPRDMPGELLKHYVVRLARGLQQHSPTWKDESLRRLADSAPTAFKNAVGQIYADAEAAGNNPATVPMGQLREIVKRRQGGGEIREFVGDPGVFLAPFVSIGQAVKRIGDPKDR